MTKKPDLPPDLDKRFSDLEEEILDLETQVIEKKYEQYKLWHTGPELHYTLQKWFLSFGRPDLFRRRYGG